MNDQANESLTNEEKNDISKPVKRLSRLKRRRRISIREQSRLMSINEIKEPGYHYHLATDENNWPLKLWRAGYEFVDVNGKELERSERTNDPLWKASVWSQDVGNGKIGYLMRIPEEFKQESDKEIQDLIDSQERECKIASPYNKGSSPSEKAVAIGSRKYGEIKIEHKVK